jgi:hypothetical protein
MVSGWQRTGLLCDGATGLGRVIATYARTLSDEIDSLTPHAATEGLNHLVGLLPLHDPARRDRLGSARESLRTARLAQVCRYIGDNLTEHRMTPSVVAIANGMSERSLHLLFEHTGETFARYLQRRRLQGMPLHADERGACRALDHRNRLCLRVQQPGDVLPGNSA